MTTYPKGVRPDFDPLLDDPVGLVEKVIAATTIDLLDKPVEGINRRQRRVAKRAIQKRLGGRCEVSKYGGR